MSEAPRYRAYSAAAGRVEFTWTDRGDNDNGDGRYRMSFESCPIGESSNPEALAESLNAHFGREPGDTVYLVDADQILIRTLRCEKHVATVGELNSSLERQGRWHFIAWTLFVLCLASFAASAIAQMPLFGLAVFALSAMLYLGIVLTGLQNECEGAVVVLIILVLCLLLFPAVREARERAEAKQNKQSQVTPDSGPTSGRRGMHDERARQPSSASARLAYNALCRTAEQELFTCPFTIGPASTPAFSMPFISTGSERSRTH